MSATRQPVDPVDRAHLTGISRPTPPIFRYPAGGHLRELVDRFWIPVWSLRAPQTQSTLQHPVCLLVISNSYARCYGVVRGRSSVTLDGDGWAVGVMLRPAAGRLLLGRPVAELTDRQLPLTDVTTLAGDRLTEQVRAAMTEAPADPHSHARAIAAMEAELERLLPVDPQGRRVNEIVAWLADHPEVSRVAAVAEQFGMGERSLQRLLEQRVGLSPKWLIQRRRLHDAVLALKTGDASLATIAHDLGYTDQAHFTHDFHTVTGMTPGAYLADQPARRERSTPAPQQGATREPDTPEGGR